MTYSHEDKKQDNWDSLVLHINLTLSFNILVLVFFNEILLLVLPYSWVFRSIISTL